MASISRTTLWHLRGFSPKLQWCLMVFTLFFITEVLFYPLGKTNNKISIISLLLLSFVIGTILRIQGINYLPFGLHTAFFAILFYGMGYLSKNVPKYLSETPAHYQWILILSCFCIQILCIGNYSSKISQCTLPYLPLASVGILLYLMLSIKIKRNKAIEYLGRNSLIIFAFQEPVYRAIIFIFSKALNQEVEILRGNLLYSLAITCVSILIIIPAIIIYNKFIRQKINNLF